MNLLMKLLPLIAMIWDASKWVIERIHKTKEKKITDQNQVPRAVEVPHKNRS
jgi:hypothetical protein